MGNQRLVSLAAGVVQEFPPEEAVHAAARAGFNAAGIWCELDSWDDGRTRRVAQALAATDLVALDIEVLWLQPGERIDCHDRMLDIAQQLAVRNILCISTEPELAATKRRFEHLCRRLENSSVRLVLEFLAFTEVRTLAQALEVVTDVGHACGGILVDALHLARTGADATNLQAIDRALLPYVQLCDAPAQPQDNSPEGLLEEALHQRLLPAEGALPLQALLDSLDPHLPLSMEIRSRALVDAFPHDPVGRATQVYRATRRLLDARRPVPIFSG